MRCKFLSQSLLIGLAIYTIGCRKDIPRHMDGQPGQSAIQVEDMANAFNYEHVISSLGSGQTIVFAINGKTDTLRAATIAGNIHLPDGGTVYETQNKDLVFIAPDRLSIYFSSDTAARTKSLNWFATGEQTKSFYDNNKKGYAESLQQMAPSVVKNQRLFDQSTYCFVERNLDIQHCSGAEQNELSTYMQMIQSLHNDAPTNPVSSALKTTGSFIPPPAQKPVWWIHITRKSSSIDPWGPFAAVIKGFKTLTDYFTVWGTWSDIQDFTKDQFGSLDETHQLSAYKYYINRDGAGINYLGGKVVNMYLNGSSWSVGSSENGIASIGKSESGGYYVCVARTGKDEVYAHEVFHTLGAQHNSSTQLRAIIPIIWLPLFWTDVMYPGWDYFMWTPKWEMWNRDNRMNVQNNLFSDNPQ